MTNAPDPQQHATALFALLDSEWPGSGDEARNGRVLHSHYDWQASRIGMLGDQLVTHYGVYDIQMRIGMASLRTAGVNLVVTQPQQRGRGLMTATAQASLAAMHTAGYDLSLVCNATEGFYGRLGYLFAWPEHDFLIDVAHLPSEASDVALVAVQPSQRADFAALYNRDHAQITGTAVRPTFARGKHPGNRRGVCWHDQQGNSKAICSSTSTRRARRSGTMIQQAMLHSGYRCLACWRASSIARKYASSACRIAGHSAGGCAR